MTRHFSYMVRNDRVVEVENYDLPPFDLTCDDCGDPFDPAVGCTHDGRQRCASCLIHCSQCAGDYFDDRGL